LNEACQHFNLTVASDSFLGAGAFGFVFRAQRVDGAHVALKIVLNANVQRLETEKSKTLGAKQVCPDAVIGLVEDGFHTFEYGAALLMSEVGEHFSSLTPQSIMDSLQKLHKSGIMHGDVRLENAVCVNGKPCWIDFAGSDRFLDAPRLMKTETDALIGFLRERFNGYEAVH
jgi:serine/threonine protein kinase